MLNRGLSSKEAANAHDMAKLSLISKRLLPIQPLLLSLMRILDGLENCCSFTLPGFSNAQTLQWQQFLKSSRDSAMALQDNAQVLQQKLAECSQLLTWILSYKSQCIAEQQNERVLQLTHSTVDDSATVRVMTAITLVFLSFTAIAVSVHVP